MISRVAELSLQDMEASLDVDFFEQYLGPSILQTSAPSQEYTNIQMSSGITPIVPDIDSPPSPPSFIDLDTYQNLHLQGSDLEDQRIEDIKDIILTEEGMIPAPESPCSVISTDSDCSDGLPLFYDYFAPDIHPFFWDKTTVKSWVLQKAKDYGLKNVNLDNFDMTGEELCSLSIAEFRNLCTDGDLLFLALEMQPGNHCQPGVKMSDLLWPGNPFPFRDTIPQPLFPKLPNNQFQEIQQNDDSSLDSPQSDTDTDMSSETQSVNGASDDDWLPEKPTSPGRRQCSSTAKRSTDKPKKVIHSRRGRPRSDGRIPSPNRGNRSVHLYEFLRDLLEDDKYCPRYITWTSREKGIFRLVNSGEVAKLWGQRKNRSNMNYEKMSRALRYYYDRNILERVGQRLVYKFSDEASKVLEQKYTDQ